MRGSLIAKLKIIARGSSADVSSRHAPSPRDHGRYSCHGMRRRRWRGRRRIEPLHEPEREFHALPRYVRAESTTSPSGLNSHNGLASSGTVTPGSTRQVFTGTTDVNMASTDASNTQTISVTTPGVTSPSDVVGLVKSNGAKQYQGSGEGTNYSEVALATSLNSSLGATSLSYTFLGGSTRLDVTGSGTSGTTDINTSSFFGGQKTVTSDMPGSGTATYTGAYNGRSYAGTIGSPYSVTNTDGSVSMTADFAAGTVNGRVDNYRAVIYDANGNVTSSSSMNGSLAFAGTVSGNTFSGTASRPKQARTRPSLQRRTAAVCRADFGPQAAEAAGALSTKFANGQSFIASQGVFGAKKN